ncbi:MAG: hypothetical protein Q8Q09_29140 [Deltaproteobacteria bacterium]|nr:hypothetical protein [Deltaproteobacteria bacterium]
MSKPAVASNSLALWIVFIAGLLAIPVGLYGFRWLERANLERIGFSQTVELQAVSIDRACMERGLSGHFGARYVRSYDDALLIQLPALQYPARPERVHMVARTRGQHGLSMETAFFRSRPLPTNYDAVINGGMSEAIDAIATACATATQSRSWQARCVSGPRFTRTCPSLRSGMLLPEAARIPTEPPASGGPR